MNTTSSAVPTIKCEEAASPVAMATAEGAGGGGGGVGAADGFLSVNVNLSTAVTSLLAVESACSTPRTPEILNSLIAMSNPLDQYQYTNEKCPTPGNQSGSGNESSSQSSGSPATSPAGAHTPSIQKTCSELIKAGLKLSIESKRKHSGSEPETGSVKRLKREDSDEDYDSSHTHHTKSEGLTPEDEERRRRRRERNKIAATKCRLKKRERTVNLVNESEVLESQNQDLKSQLKDLEVQRRQLVDMLSLHTASCIKNTGASAPYTLRYDSPAPFPGYEATSPYIRPESANILASSYTCPTSLNGDSSIDTISSLDNSYMTPQIIEPEYARPDSVLSIPAPAEHGFATADGFLARSTNLLVIEPEQEYYEPEPNAYMQAQQCHGYVSVPETQAKVNGGLNDGCLV
ncbi:Activating transcription factor 3 [Eumeta japonica]|uniref:Activating transcription factor 3 n=1 Tax=Eumeta variegata TaxID=151549 RepID=A0A4C1WGD5_EUMVA|nr:Activating transcription factor 3 [Eumeta japonica]